MRKGRSILMCTELSYPKIELHVVITPIITLAAVDDHPPPFVKVNNVSFVFPCGLAAQSVTTIAIQAAR